MSTKTENYQLNQWEPSDSFLRSDFNEDNARLDAALAQKCEAFFGSYTGDGTAQRVIPLGFTPRAVLVKQPGNDLNYGSTEELKRLIAVAVQGVPGNVLNVVEGGFQIINHGHVNGKNTLYVYFAFR